MTMHGAKNYPRMPVRRVNKKNGSLVQAEATMQKYNIIHLFIHLISYQVHYSPKSTKG